MGFNSGFKGLKHDIQLNAYHIMFINSVINKPKKNVVLKKEVQQLRFISIPYPRGVSEKFKRVVNRYNSKIVFRRKHTL